MAKGKITVHNKISACYRELHVDGAFGGVTPRGFINLSFYAERQPIPKSTDIEITDEGLLGEAVVNSKDSKQGILREFEFGIYMDVHTAKSVLEFLKTKIEDLEQIVNTKNGKRITK